jgi:hypothetical protein
MIVKSRGRGIKFLLKFIQYNNDILRISIAFEYNINLLPINKFYQ